MIFVVIGVVVVLFVMLSVGGVIYGVFLLMLLGIKWWDECF